MKLTALGLTSNRKDTFVKACKVWIRGTQHIQAACSHDPPVDILVALSSHHCTTVFQPMRTILKVPKISLITALNSSTKKASYHLLS